MGTNQPHIDGYITSSFCGLGPTGSTVSGFENPHDRIRCSQAETADRIRMYCSFLQFCMQQR